MCQLFYVSMVTMFSQRILPKFTFFSLIFDMYCNEIFGLCAEFLPKSFQLLHSYNYNVFLSSQINFGDFLKLLKNIEIQYGVTKMGL